MWAKPGSAVVDEGRGRKENRFPDLWCVALRGRLLGERSHLSFLKDVVCVRGCLCVSMTVHIDSRGPRHLGLHVPPMMLTPRGNCPMTQLSKGALFLSMTVLFMHRPSYPPKIEAWSTLLNMSNSNDHTALVEVTFS